jgi:predicted ATPase
LIDEAEAHLHPFWQRVIVPAIMKVLEQLSSSVKPQIHLATHSPLILASAEAIFDEQVDDLHHLRLAPDRSVVLEELSFVKRGTADVWLVSEAFGLAQARSIPSEEAIEDAKSLQANPNPASRSVIEVHARLVRYLAPDDEFWPRWLFFAKQHGVER